MSADSLGRSLGQSLGQYGRIQARYRNAEYAAEKLNGMALARARRTRMLLWRHVTDGWFTPNAAQRGALVGCPSGEFPVVLAALYDLSDPDFYELLFEQGMYPDSDEWQILAEQKGIPAYVDFFASTATKLEIDLEIEGKNAENKAPNKLTSKWAPRKRAPQEQQPNE